MSPGQTVFFFFLFGVMTAAMKWRGEVIGRREERLRNEPYRLLATPIFKALNDQTDRPVIVMFERADDGKTWSAKTVRVAANDDGEDET